MKLRLSNRNDSSGITLLELLVVIGILAILAVLVIPAFNSTSSATNLTSAADRLKGSIALARQNAITMNSKVELRFFQMEDGIYTAYASYYIQDGSADRPVDTLTTLDQKIAFLSNPSYSSLLSNAPESGTEELPGRGTVPYVAFRFDSSGSAVLPSLPDSQPWNLTIVEKKDAAASALPDNYATLTLAPLTGTVSLHRP